MTAPTPDRRVVVCQFGPRPHPLDDECQNVTDAPGEPVTKARSTRALLAGVLRPHFTAVERGTGALDAAVDDVLSALGSRLVPPDADTRTQWAVRRDGSIGMALGRRADAEWAMERSLAFARRHEFAVHVPELVQREMRHYPDGSSWVGPWLPVPTTPTEES